MLNIARSSDVIAILKGGRVPFILQKSEAGSGAFRLVAEYHVHYMMNDEKLSLPEVNENKFRDH